MKKCIGAKGQSCRTIVAPQVGLDGADLSSPTRAAALPNVRRMNSSYHPGYGAGQPDSLFQCGLDWIV